MKYYILFHKINVICTSFQCSIASGNTAGKFAINTATGAITVDAALDYETDTSYELVLNCAGLNIYHL